MLLQAPGQPQGLVRRFSFIEQWCSLGNIPPLEGGDRWFESSLLDQHTSVA
jgi:hypothetical protein